MEVDSSKKKHKDLKDIRRLSSLNKPYISIAKKEIKMIIRTPVYVLNSLIGVIIFPIIILMNIITGDSSTESIIQFIELYPEYLILGSVGLITLLGVMNSIGSTTFSREGKNFWIQRTLPIKAENQIIGRVLSSLMIQLIGVIALILSLSFIAKISPMDVIVICFFRITGKYSND